MLKIVMGVTESKTSPRHLNFLKVLRLLGVLVLDASGHPPFFFQVHEAVKEEHKF